MLIKTVKCAAVSAVALLAACQASNPTISEEMGNKMPGWVLNPPSESGLASATCVVASNLLNIDKTQAATSARAELATILDSRVASLQEQLTKKSETAGASISSTEFQSVVKQMSDQVLRGSKITKMDYASINNKNNFCVLVTMAEKDVQSLISGLVSKTPIELSPEDERVLVMDFLKKEMSES